MSSKILFIVPYPFNTAPSQRLKFEQYYTELGKMGYEITDRPFISTQFWKIVYKKGFYLKKIFYTIIAYFKRYTLLTTLSKYDIVYVHLWGTPFGTPLYEYLLCKFSKKLVYDIDDLVYKGNSSPNNKYVSILKSGSKVNFLMKHADEVLVSTDKLLDYTRQFTHKVSLIPATIDVKKYDLKSINKSDAVVVGWSGSHTTSKYVHILDNVFKKLASAHNIKIMIMGDPAFTMDSVNIELVQWSAEKEIEYLQLFDIGIHPVPDEEWVYGKSGGKLVQYMAAGIPIVASAIGPNFKVIKNEFNGFLVNSEEEWLNKLELLIINEALRKQMGVNSRHHAETFFSVETNLKHYLAIFNNLSIKER
ncbi:MAG: glycosyltransferase family 4 protein [Bacteroidota bacterium]